MSAGEPQTALAIDVGGTKILVALVRDGVVLERNQVPTPRDGGGDAWCAAIVDAAAAWHGRYSVVGAAVTGGISDGRWYAVNPETLPVPEGFPLEATLSRMLGLPVRCTNDAQAAGWGEYRRGAGQGHDMAFVTISTGIGGGLVLGGRLVSGITGLGGHVGLLPLATPDGSDAIENLCSGRWVARQADGRAEDARAVFSAAEAGESWAQAILDLSMDRAALVLRTVQWIVDPAVIVVGGGIGLVPSYFAGLRQRLTSGPHRTELRPALLGGDAGAIGAAELAVRHSEMGTLHE